MQLSSACVSKDSTRQRYPTASVVVIGSLCLICIIGLLIGAFTSDSSDSLTSTCIQIEDSVSSETLNVLVMFALGYVCSLATKNRQALSRHAHRLTCLWRQMVSSTFASIASLGDRIRSSGPLLQPTTWISTTCIKKDVVAILLAATLCSLCIGGLVISAFTAEIDADPAGSGLASESSTSMKAFTVGWMCMLSFKLRRELVGLVGSSWLLQPI